MSTTKKTVRKGGKQVSSAEDHLTQTAPVASDELSEETWEKLTKECFKKVKVNVETLVLDNKKVSTELKEIKRAIIYSDENIQDIKDKMERLSEEIKH